MKINSLYLFKYCNLSQKIRFFFLFAFAFSFPFPSFLSADALYQYTPSDVYTETLRIQGDIKIISEHFKSAPAKIPPLVETQLKPRHAWQKTYEIMVKINILREKYGLPRIEEVGIKPLKNLDPGLTHGQVRRILSELDIFMTRVGIKNRTSVGEKQFRKTPADVYNLLSRISAQLDAVNKGSFAPTHVFAQNMRILDDTNLILERLDIYERIGPPNKNKGDRPSDTYKMALKIIDQIHRLQMLASIDQIDFSHFKRGKITPSDVFEISQIILAEIQTIKAHLQIYSVTIPAKVYADKTPADSKQLLAWILRKLIQIRSLEY